MHNKRGGMANYVWKVFILDYLIVLRGDRQTAEHNLLK